MMNDINNNQLPNEEVADAQPTLYDEVQAVTEVQAEQEIQEVPKKKKLSVKKLVAIISALAAMIVVLAIVVIPRAQYSKFESLIEDKKYDEAVSVLGGINRGFVRDNHFKDIMKISMQLYVDGYVNASYALRSAAGFYSEIDYLTENLNSGDPVFAGSMFFSLEADCKRYGVPEFKDAVLKNVPVLQLLQDIQGTWAPATASHAYDTFVITDGYVYKTTGENSYYHLYIKKASDGYAYVYCQIGDPTSDSDGRILYYVGGEDDTFVYEKLYSGSSNATYIAYQKVK